MRTAFINELIVQARIHPEIFLVVGDLGYSVVEAFAREFPDRFLNAGVAEQNMTGVAAGLASEGYHVFTYSIANFPTLRCLEQIRNDICYHNLPVTVVAVGGGVAYGNLGYSHHAVQDIGIMRTLPNITVLSPADPGETEQVLRWLVKNPCPSYLRLGKAGELRLHEVPFRPHEPILVREGDCTTALVATGSVLALALDAAARLGEQGIGVPVYSMPWLCPLVPDNLRCLIRYDRLFVLEEHLPQGGLADLIRRGCPGVKVEEMSLAGDECNTVGNQKYLRDKSGLSTNALLGRW